MSETRSFSPGHGWSTLRRVQAILFSGLLGCLLSTPFTAAGEIQPTHLKAAGKGTAILRIDQSGRYSVQAASSQGTSLQLIDKMTGPGMASGSPGSRDGRLDLFLEKGEYKIVTEGHEQASGEVELTVEAFSEGNSPAIPLLPELKLVETDLRDLQQRSYWIQVLERRTVTIEAAGRSLADLRIWKDGAWLLDSAPLRVGLRYPQEGKPLTAFFLETALDPGLYQVVAYGGPPAPWSTDEDQSPLFLRSGIPFLGEVSRSRYEVSPFGIDRFRVAEESSYFRIELPLGGEALLRVGSHPGFATSNEGPSSYSFIEKETLPPITVTYQQGEYVAVEALAGTPYILQHFEWQESYSVGGRGNFWVSTVQSGAAQDELDVTGILVPEDGQGPTPESQAVILNSETEFVRRANLNRQTTLFLEVTEGGSYEFKIEGLESRVRIEPFFPFSPPQSYQPPPYKGGYSSWDLPTGTYVLTVEPYDTGVADLMIRPYSLLGNLMEWTGLGDAPPAAASPAGAAIFPPLSLSSYRTYRLFLNQRPGVEVAPVVRRLPIDLRQALPLAQRPGQVIDVPFRSAEAGTLTALAEDGSYLEISIDGSTWSQRLAVPSGRHTARIRSDASVTLQYSLRLEPTRLGANQPLPELPSDARPASLDFPTLEAGSPRFLDLKSGTDATFLVNAPSPGLYKLASTGLLALAGNLRSRTVPSFSSSAQNGVGRNFAIQQYLGQGDYQLTVKPVENSSGHLGVYAERSDPLTGGELSVGLPERISLPPDRAVEYRFEIAQAGDYHLQSLGLGRQFRCRLEDSEGWPLLPPNGPADITHRFEAGRYRLVILPETTAARAVTLLEPAQKPRQTEGHGPHDLALNETQSHVWMEPSGTDERLPDQWHFSVPAEVEAVFELTNEMQGSLYKLPSAGEASAVSVATIFPGRVWAGKLDPGAYRLDTSCSRKNNRTRYSLSVKVRDLVAGLHQQITAPARVPVSIGDAGLVQISSFGTSDVKARLLDGEGTLLSASDDRRDDWNFLIAERLGQGHYFLDIEPVGSGSAATTVSMEILTDEIRQVESLPFEQRLSLAREAVVIPLQLPAESDILLIAAESDAPLGLTLEAEIDARWTEIATTEAQQPRIELPFPSSVLVSSSGSGAVLNPLGAGTPYRLRAWSSSGKEVSATVRAAGAVVAAQDESRLASGNLQWDRPSSAPWIRLARIELKEPGMMYFSSLPDEARLSDASTPVLGPISGENASGFGRDLWISIPDGKNGVDSTVAAERLAIEPGTATPLQVDLPRGTPRVCNVDASSGQILIVEASSQAGQPGIAVTTAGSRAANPDGRLMAAGDRSALSAAFTAGKMRLIAWNADHSAHSVEAQVQASTIPAAPVAAGSDAWEGAVNGPEARTYALPSGEKQITLSLGAGLVGIVSQGEVVQSVHWLDDQPFSERFATGGDRLTIVHRGEGTAHFAVVVSKGGTPLATGPLTADQHVEARFETSGLLRVPVKFNGVAGSRKPWLAIAGAVESATLITDTGLVIRGDLGLDAPLSGEVIVRHGPGLGLAWIENDGTSERLFGKTGSARKTKVDRPMSISLSGNLQELEVNLGRPAVIHLRGASEALSRLVTAQRGGTSGWVEVHPEGIRLDAFLPEGKATVQLRALGDSVLAGVLDIAQSQVVPIGEGLGPESLLAPGSSRFFSFETTRAGKIGIGVRASSEVVEAELLSPAGKVIGTGPVQFLELAAGHYLLALRAPTDTPPVTVRPALAGVSPPGEGPPEAVIEAYMHMETAGTEATQTDSESAPEEGEDQ